MLAALVLPADLILHIIRLHAAIPMCGCRRVLGQGSCGNARLLSLLRSGCWCLCGCTAYSSGTNMAFPRLPVPRRVLVSRWLDSGISDHGLARLLLCLLSEPGPSPVDWLSLPLLVVKRPREAVPQLLASSRRRAQAVHLDAPLRTSAYGPVGTNRGPVDLPVPVDSLEDAMDVDDDLGTMGQGQVVGLPPAVFAPPPSAANFILLPFCIVVASFSY